MSQAPARAAFLFPGALGDFICVLPALWQLLQRCDDLLVVAKAEWLELIEAPNLRKASIDRSAVADLFAAGPLKDSTRRLFEGCAQIYSWTGFGNPQVATRLASASGGQVSMFPFRGMFQNEPAADFYARCVGVQALPVPPNFVVQDQAWISGLRRAHDLPANPYVVLHPGSGSAKKNWLGFQLLAQRWKAQEPEAIVVLHGPAESGIELPEADVVVGGVSLPKVAALLRASSLYLGNDSGISHLAGLLQTDGVVLFGSGDASVWAPRSAHLEVLQAQTACEQCPSDSFCMHRLDVERVLAALQERRRQTPSAQS